MSTWKTLEEFYRDGRSRSIGVSNFQPHHLRRLHGESEIPPAVNQIEVHPYLTQDDVRAFCAEHQIADIVFPKSTTPARIKENIGIFDFELSGADVESISALNKNERTGPDPDKFDMV